MYSIVTTQRFVFIPPIIPITESNPLDREKVLNRLRKAVRVCNMVMTGKKVPGFHPTERNLSSDEKERIQSGMDYLSFMLSNSVLWPRPLDFDVECFCDCQTTVGCLQGIGMHTLWDIVDSKGDDYLGCLAIAEHVAGAEKQYHMHALVEKSDITY